MKRHPALAPLSRDHHQVLVIAQQLRRATSENTDETTHAFLSHWETEEKQHSASRKSSCCPSTQRTPNPTIPL